jgi:hypothetical protein
MLVEVVVEVQQTPEVQVDKLMVEQVDLVVVVMVADLAEMLV